MLRVIFGYPSKALRSGKDYINDFAEEKSVYKPAEGGLPPGVVMSDFAKRAILGVDMSIVYHPNCIKSPVLGIISYKRLSHGVKNLIILENVDEIIPLEFMGDNCFPYLAELSSKKDVTVCTANIRPLFNYNFKEVYTIDTGVIVKNNMSFYNEYYKCFDTDTCTFRCNDISERIDYYEAYGLNIWGDDNDWYVYNENN